MSYVLSSGFGSNALRAECEHRKGAGVTKNNLPRAPWDTVDFPLLSWVYAMDGDRRRRFEHHFFVSRFGKGV